VLIVTRRAGEKVMLGDDVVVAVMEIVGSTVRIGIDAPRSVPVYREEIWHAVKEENEAAGAGGHRGRAGRRDPTRLNRGAPARRPRPAISVQSWAGAAGG
jgi:carbon storage regulator